MSQKWFPKKLTQMEEFLPEELKPLRNYVKYYRNDDISFELHVFEERVLFSEGDKKLSWSIIGSYEDYISQKTYNTESRHVKKLFLQAWMEIQAWERGSRKKQLFYDPPENIQQICTKKEDQFFYGESTHFSIDCMNNYLSKYLKLPPRKRHQRPRFFNLKQSRTSKSQWQVFVHNKLWKYYYDSNERIEDLHTDHFLAGIEEMSTLNCTKKDEACHAAIANFDSWQFFLHILTAKEGDIMNNNDSILEKLEQLKTDAENDPQPIPQDISYIIQKLSYKRLCELNQKEQTMIKTESHNSPKIQLEMRKAQLRYFQAKKEQAYQSHVDHMIQPGLFDIIKSFLTAILLCLKNIFFPQDTPMIKRPAIWAPVPVCLLLLWFFFTAAVSETPLLNQSYQMALMTNTTFQDIQIDGNELSFASVPREDFIHRSFSAGVLDGKNHLLKNDSIDRVSDLFYPDTEKQSLNHWSEIPDVSFYFSLAKWCFLINSSYESDVQLNSTFWEIQLKFINDLISDFHTNAVKKNEDKGIINNSLNTVESILTSSNNYQLTKKQYRLIRNEAFRLIKHFL